MKGSITPHSRERLAAQIGRRPIRGRAECRLCLDTYALDERSDCYNPECMILSKRLLWHPVRVRWSDGMIHDDEIRGEDEADALICAQWNWPDASEVTLRTEGRG